LRQSGPVTVQPLPDEHVDEADCCLGDIDGDLARPGAGSGSSVTRRTSGAPKLASVVAGPQDDPAVGARRQMS